MKNGQNITKENYMFILNHTSFPSSFSPFFLIVNANTSPLEQSLGD